MGPHPAVAAVRLAVRRAWADLEPGSRVLVACSGGADSLALLAATVFEARKPAHTVIGVTVDHGLQAGSADHAKAVAEQMATLGAEAHVVTVEVGTTGGPEAAARTARYAALDAAADEHRAETILLGHTRDDQAETVLLGLARGSGARSLSGMAPRQGRYRRPLLDLTREDTRAACAAEQLTPWDDPHNDDPAYTRVRVRHDVLPVLERELGPGVTEALARTARLLRDDADALDAWAERVLGDVTRPGAGLDAGALRHEPPAVRRRVLRRTALDAGCPGTELFAVHVDAMDALLTDWHGQAGVDLPGGLRMQRQGGRLTIAETPVAG
ncbi:MAG TPA: tRNA lysidine(34) synthetase TilS [Nocardioidaceae bacterium]|nr:tRNA lysidine(34) synthetase TilS [Nocardioidaceae bacterium]